MGLPDSGRVPRIIVDPRDPDIVFVAVMGHCYGPQKDKGVYRTLDGGVTWEKVLYVDEVTGCSDMVMDPNNPRILLAGMWAFQMTHWSRNGYAGPDGGLYLSRNGGTTWEKLTIGLPKGPTGKIAVTMSANDSNRMYALIENLEGTLWRSDDAGHSWKRINESHTIQNRPVYYTRLAVSPEDCNELYSVAGQISISTDGGETFKRLSLKGGDNHDMWIDPKNANRMMVANDQHISISINRGKTWNGVTLPNAQMYHVTVDNQIPYFVYGNKQDGPSCCGPSNSKQRRIPSTLWHSVGGGEAGFTVPDPVDSNIVWSGEYQGQLTRWDRRTGHTRGVSVWKEDFIAHPPKDLKYRFQWTMPITISPHDHNKIYVGSQYVHATTNGGQSWEIISPDLTTSAPDMMERNFELIAESADPIMSCAVFAIAESPVEQGQIWAGSNDGLLHVTRDGGETWTNVTDNIPNFPPRGKITNIEPSRYEAGSCYFSCDLHEMNHWDTYIYKTTDYGKTWKNISSNIPKGYLSYAHCIREDPVRKGLLYLGTENMVYASFNDGGSWIPLQEGLPHAPVHWLVVQEHFNDLVIGTYGRGFYILDDITPLQQLTQEVFKSDAHFFTPRPAYRFLSVSSYQSASNDLVVGQNPDYGAAINYYLGSVPSGDVTIRIQDEEGDTIRTLKGTKKIGINRVMWDLRHKTLRAAKLRTPPVGEHFVPYGPEGWRPLIQYGGRLIQILAPPGTYTAKLSVNGKELEQKILVKKDPSSAGTEQDIQVQTGLLLKLRKNQDDLIKMINSFEWIRKQLYDLKDILQKNEGLEDALTQLDALDKKIMDVEWNFFALNCTGSADTLRFAAGLYTKIPSLARGISRADFPPTDSQIELQKVLEKELIAHQESYEKILTQDLVEFNNMLNSENISNIIVLDNP
ncbi:sialidase [Acidobacteriota bacterium]